MLRCGDKCVRKGQEWQLALDLFIAMTRAIVKANAISYGVATDTCRMRQEWQLALLAQREDLSQSGGEHHLLRVATSAYGRDKNGNSHWTCSTR